MQLPYEISISPPPFTNNNGDLIKPESIKLSFLNVTYMDNPTEKTLYAMIAHIPARILLAKGDDYISIGDYTHEQLENLLKKQLGEDIAVKLRSLFPKTLEENPNGPGSILAGMFSLLGIKSSPTCSCKRHAIEMNDRGNDWCENNMDTIISWLKEESKKRNLPFIESVAKMIVKKAINKSRKLLSEHNNTAV